MSEKLTEDVAGLKATMDIMMKILMDIQRKIEVPLPQIEEKFKNQESKIVDLEHNQKAFEKDVAIRFELAATAADLKDFQADVKLLFTELATREKENQGKPRRVLVDIGTLVVIIGAVVTGVNWAFHHIK